MTDKRVKEQPQLRHFAKPARWRRAVKARDKGKDAQTRKLLVTS